MGAFEEEIDQVREFQNQDRFREITRLYSPRQVVEQNGTLPQDYTVAREAAEGFYARLRELFGDKKSITSFGPYSPGQVVQMKRSGIEGIYLGGWATSAKGSTTEDPGPDLASYPLSQVPDEAGGLVRALLTADKNQKFARARMSQAERDSTPEVDFRPWIIADADTGHGGEAHVRNLVRRFVEVGVPGYHIEDQKPGAKKCGHQGGKVLVPSSEQVQRLNAARFQLDIMKVPGIIVARTAAEAANLIEGSGDERDQPFILGATNVSVPSYKTAFLAAVRQLNTEGVDEINGHLLHAISDLEYEEADAWLKSSGVAAKISSIASAYKNGEATANEALDAAGDAFLAEWQTEAGLKTLAEAVADLIEFRRDEESAPDISREDWLAFASRASWYEIRAKAREGEHAVLPQGHRELLRGEAVDLVAAVGDEVEDEAQLAEFLWKASHFFVAHAGGVPIERWREIVGEHLVWKLRMNRLGELARVIKVGGFGLHPEQVGEGRRRK